MPPPLDPQHYQFLRLYAEQEHSLHGCVRSMLPDRHETSQVTLTVWQGAASAEKFRPWAFGVARMHLRRRVRDRHVF